MVEYTVMVYADGTKVWFRHGEIHREDGPAAEYADGSGVWFRHGEIHREDGPAIEKADGTKKWYLDGVRLTKEQFIAQTSHKEMTVADIEKALGYRIKIVKEKNQ